MGPVRGWEFSWEDVSGGLVAVILAVFCALVLNKIGAIAVPAGRPDCSGNAVPAQVIYWLAVPFVAVLVLQAALGWRDRQIVRLVLYSLAGLIVVAEMIAGRAIVIAAHLDTSCGV